MLPTSCKRGLNHVRYLTMHKRILLERNLTFVIYVAKDLIKVVISVDIEKSMLEGSLSYLKYVDKDLNKLPYANS